SRSAPRTPHLDFYEEQHIHDFIRSAIPKINVRPGNSKAPRASVCAGFFLAALQLILPYPTGTSVRSRPSA
ncbi:MAG TPA: hypothetical protein VK658_05290, partial [Chryseolinea sp.]|nr:hypothetical protein [Chryseolinea sp.]